MRNVVIGGARGTAWAAAACVVAACTSGGAAVNSAPSTTAPAPCTASRS